MAVLPPESPASDIKIYTRIEPFAQHGAGSSIELCSRACAYSILYILLLSLS